MLVAASDMQSAWLIWWRSRVTCAWQPKLYFVFQQNRSCCFYQNSLPYLYCRCKRSLTLIKSDSDTALKKKYLSTIDHLALFYIIHCICIGDKSFHCTEWETWSWRYSLHAGVYVNSHGLWPHLQSLVIPPTSYHKDTDITMSVSSVEAAVLSPGHMLWCFSVKTGFKASR